MGREDKTVVNRFLKWLERQHGSDGVAVDIQEPDLVAKPGGAVDLAFRIGATRYVLEHTNLPAFVLRAFEDDLFTKVVYPLEGELVGPFTLVTDATPSAYKAIKAHAADWREKVRAWILSVGALLVKNPEASTLIDGINLSLTKDDRIGQALHVGRRSRSHGPSSRADIEESVAQGLTRKLPKLELTRSSGQLD